MDSFRKILTKRETSGETNLFAKLCEIEAEGLETWLTLLGNNWGSFNSIPHIKNVEKHIDSAVPDSIKERFNSMEIFLLLSSILLHDIGKIIAEASKDENHARKSCVMIQEHWPMLKIPNFNIAKRIAILSCSHDWKKPNPNNFANGCPEQNDKKCNLICNNTTNLISSKQSLISELDFPYDSKYGQIRLTWIASLLRLGDQVDNVCTRAIPEHLLKSGDIKSWRSCISDVFFDLSGMCIKLRSDRLDPKEHPWRNFKDSEKNISRVLNETEEINRTLKNWARPLTEMGLFYKAAFLETAVPRYRLYQAHYHNDNLKEPSLSDEYIETVVNAAKKLDYSIIGGDKFTWETLAAQAGTKNYKLTRLAIQRAIANQIDIDNFKFIESNDYWKFENGEEKKSSFNSAHFEINPLSINSNNIPTNIDFLDEFLCPENPEIDSNENTNWKGGFYAPFDKTFKMDNLSKPRWISPIIVIQGSSGEGKTSLSIQIASNLISNNDNPWIVFFYSLEQEPYKVILNSINYGFINENYFTNIITFEDSPWYIKLKNINDCKIGKLVFPMLSPMLVYSDDYTINSNFERRFAEIKQCLEWLNPERLPLRCFFIIDSITAFSDIPLKRNQLNRLFSCFRKYQVPLICTLERQRRWADMDDIVSYNTSCYLSDIQINLESGHQEDGYFRHTIEVAKTRYNRRILGKHQLKLKSPKAPRTKIIDNRSGVVIYPSIDYHLSMTYRGIEHEDTSMDPIEAIVSSDFLPVGRIYEKIDNQNIFNIRKFKIDSCFVISGEHGCHKFALAINLLLNHSPKFFIENRSINKNKLIISFAEEKEIALNKVALLKEIEFAGWREYLQQIEQPEADNIGNPTQKVMIQKFGKTDQGGNGITIDILQFRMGQIMPEEVLYIINELLNKNNYNSVLVYDTAHIRNLFPALALNTMFIPVLIDIFKRYRIFSVFIDINSEDHIHKSLMAAADCRFVTMNNKGYVSFKVHNVRGKDYGQENHFVEVKAVKGNSIPELIIRKEIDNQ